MSQEKWEEGIAHLERIGNLKEPEEPKSKAHYYDGLVVLARYVANITFLIFATSPSIINLLTVSNIIDIIYVNCYELKKKRFASCFFGFSVLYVMLVAMLKLRSICVQLQLIIPSIMNYWNNQKTMTKILLVISVAAGDEITNLFSLTMSFNCIIDSQIQMSAVRSLQFWIDKNEGFFSFLFLKVENRLTQRRL